MYMHLGISLHDFVIGNKSNTKAKTTNKIVPIDAIIAPILITNS